MVTVVADDTDEYEKLYLSDGRRWSRAVKDALEVSDISSKEVVAAFGPLLHILPDIYDTLEQFGMHGLARKLEESTVRWDYYF